MLTSYSKYIGGVISTKVIKSGGILTAATNMMARNGVYGIEPASQK